MFTFRFLRLVGLAVASGALASTAVLWVGVSPAGATARAGCTLGILCPPTTTVKPPPTTKAPPTPPPKTTPPATGHTAAPTHPATTTPPARTSTGAPVLGSGGLPVPIAPGDLSAADPSAPQLAGTSVPSTTVSPIPTPALSGLVAPTRGLPKNHPTLRIALSILVLVVAVVAIAQLPASRRLPRANADTVG